MGDDNPTRCGSPQHPARQRGLTVRGLGCLIIVGAVAVALVGVLLERPSGPVLSDSSHRPNPDADIFARTVRANQALRERQEREQRERERKQEKARLAAIEAARPPAERAALATEALTGDGGDTKEAYCRARELLDPIEPKDRGAADVRKALSLMKAKQALLLHAERAAFEKTRGLMCRDGTMSPTCRCHGPHRGCCSHHRGVAGCEPLPTEVSCP
ncbi:hypothetical protein [Sorangium cellulosum]|uniref:Uncharacterized protein n=1 Tax=Sorangium cellulosum TaxID=56 RepID=A0A150Q975_SORCE|nr:hypothetical protein [Sorangium cellulosum]KYF64547.1 hypothetical protein BE15_04585 [Sorangium cellulosum]